MTASKIPSLEGKKLFESFEVMDDSVRQTAGTQSFFFSPSKVVFYRYYAIYELSLRAAVIKFISFDPENSGASITVIRFYVGQLPGPESPCIVSFTYSELKALQIQVVHNIDIILQILFCDTAFKTFSF